MEKYTRYAILLHKVPDSIVSNESVQRHIDHLRALDKQGKLVLCGPFTDYPAGMVVVHAASKSEAERIAQADPFVAEGLRTYEVRSWLLACAENNYLG